MVKHKEGENDHTKSVQGSGFPPSCTCAILSHQAFPESQVLDFPRHNHAASPPGGNLFVRTLSPMRDTFCALGERWSVCNPFVKGATVGTLLLVFVTQMLYF